jgi:hypothetical protein
VTVDADAIVDVRAHPDATRRAAAALLAAGWDASGVDDLVHRFTSSEGGTVDLLGPDGLRTRPVTVPPRRTLLAPGGTQLLRRSAPADAVIRAANGDVFELAISLPSRFGALIAKCAAAGLPEGRDRHLLDAVHLVAAGVCGFGKVLGPQPVLSSVVIRRHWAVAGGSGVRYPYLEIKVRRRHGHRCEDDLEGSGDGPQSGAGRARSR